MSVIIRLQNLPLSAASADIRNFFAGLRIPDGSVNIVGGEEGDAFIGFATDEDARQAMRKNNGLIHNTEIRLFLSSRAEMKEVIENARSAPPPSSAPPMIPPTQQPSRYGSGPPPRYDNDSSRFPPRDNQPPPFHRNDRNDRFPPRDLDPPRFGRDNGPPQFGRDSGPSQSFGRDNGPPSFGRDNGPPPPFGRDPSTQFNRDGVPPFGGRDGGPPSFGSGSRREDPPRMGRDEPPRYGRDGPPHGNGRSPFSPPGFQDGQRQPFNNQRFEGRQNERDREDRNRPPMGRNNFEQRKRSDDRSGAAPPPWKRDREGMGAMGNMRQDGDERRKEDTERSTSALPTREPDFGIFNRSGDASNQSDKKEESWRNENNRSFESKPPLAPPPLTALPSMPPKEDEVSFFGRGPSIPSQRPFLPPPSMHSASISTSFNQPSSSFNQSAPSSQDSHKPKEEVFVELSRLPADLLRPSILEEFLSPSNPLTLSSVKVVYSPEGIHLHSLVRFTSALDAFNALKKDGDQGVKIRPSTKESFESARDGMPPPTPSIPQMGGGPPQMGMGVPMSLLGMGPPQMNGPPMGGPHMSGPPMGGPHMGGPPMGLPQMGGPPMGGPQMGGPPMGGMNAGPPPMNLLSMQLSNPSMMMNGGDGRRGMMDGRGGDRRDRRRNESPPRGRNEKRRRSSSPQQTPRPKKKQVGERYCVKLANVPFKTREQDIRRMINPGPQPMAIKKIFTEDNSPSDLWVLEFGQEEDAERICHHRCDVGGRPARMHRIDEATADRLLRQKYMSPPRRDGEKKGSEKEKEDDFEAKVRKQQEAIERERGRIDDDQPLLGAFSAPVFTTNRGFMRGMRGGGRGMRGEYRGMVNGSHRGSTRGRMHGGGNGGMGMNDRNCLLITNMPAIPSPQILFDHLRIDPSSVVRCDQIGPDASIVELRNAEDAMQLADHADSPSFPGLNGRQLVIAAMSRAKIEEELNLNPNSKPPPRVDPEIVRSIGDPGCVIACDGFPRDLAIDEVKSFFDGFLINESSVRMRMEGGEGTGECMLSLSDRDSARRAVDRLNGRRLRGNTVTLLLM